MEPIAYWLPLVWAALLGVGVAMYVLLDGFDLGIGILFLTGADERERDAMMNSIAPYWDGNETWLVLGGAGLLVAFPLAYAIIMPALYLPLIIMLLALVFRGVAFEFASCPSRGIAGGTGPSRWALRWPPFVRALCLAVSCKAST